MERQRLQFDVAKAAVERLDDLAERLHVSTRGEVMRKALALLDHVVQAQAEGGHLILRTDKGERELIII